MTTTPWFVASWQALHAEVRSGLGEHYSVFRLDCLVHVLKGLRGYGRNHLLQRNFVFHGVSTAEAIKGTLQIPQFVGSKGPISAPRGDPQSDMTGLNRSYHEIANTRKIAHCIQGRRGIRSRGRRLRQ